MITVLLILTGLILLLFTGIPIFAALTLFGAALLKITQGELGSISDVIFHDINRYMLVALPMFAFMAQVMIRGKIVDDLFDTAHTLTRHLRGGLSIATIAACTIFAAISGSSVATALTIGAVAIPQMIKYGYDPKAAYGLVAAGGTLGILIPPSGPMVLYGVITDTSIGGLFMAGVVPGLMIAGIFVIWSILSTCYGSRKIERLPKASAAEIRASIRKSIWALLMPVIVLGGMYTGVFTATEAAAAGAVVALLVAVVIYRTIGVKEFWLCARDASHTAAMLFMILAGASVFGFVLTKMRLPQEIVHSVVSADLGVAGFLLSMMVLLFVLGMFLDSISIILITTPVILPAMQHLGINPIWYGVLMVINLELGQITPPVGLNLFTIRAITKASMSDVIRGSAPYVALLILGLLLVMGFPSISLWLPGTMMGL